MTPTADNCPWRNSTEQKPGQPLRASIRETTARFEAEVDVRFRPPSAPRTASAFSLSAQNGRVLPINRLARRPPTVSRLDVRRLRLHAPEQIGDAVCDVVTDQPRALDALDAA